MAIESVSRVKTGIIGLDEILMGGLLPGRAYMVRGGPGSGKTTMGFHFLKTAIDEVEKALFITLEEAEYSLRSDAMRQSIDLSRVEFLDLSPSSQFFTTAETYDIFSPAEVEREPITSKIVEKIQSLKPTRVFLDPLTQFRYLSSDLFQFRKQVLSFLRFLTEQGATVLFTTEGSSEAPDDDLQFLSDGIIQIDSALGIRTVSITKARGLSFKSGLHSMRITDRGIRVYPKIMPEEYWKKFKMESLSSGVPELDELLNGGLERGTVSLIGGPSGTGKTSLGLQFMKEAAGRGERSVVYTFDEAVQLIVSRCESINIPAENMIARGTLLVEKIEPLRYSIDEFCQLVRTEVEQSDAQMVMIDSVAGFRIAVKGENPINDLHALCKYLQHMGVSVLLVAETANISGSSFRVSDIEINYLADNIIFLRYLELEGEMRKAIGVLKKRLTDFEKKLREFKMTRYGIKLGLPLAGVKEIFGLPE